MEDIAGTIFSPYTRHLIFLIVTYTMSLSLSDKEKLRLVKNKLRKSINGTLGMDCKTLGTTSVPGVKVSANQRPVFGHMTIEWYIVSLIYTHIWTDKGTRYTIRNISFSIFIYGWEISVSEARITYNNC